MPERLLEVTHLSVQYGDGGDPSRAAVNDISFSIDAGEVIGLTGPSGCGKTTTALSITGLLPKTARVSGSISFGGRDLRRLSERDLRAIRGASIAIVFQEPGLALHPLMTVGAQIADIVRAHQRCRRDVARAHACEAMRDVGLGADLPRIYDAYPHELSGGQAQRVLLAQALVCRPSLVMADEPTSSLDATLRAEILQLMSRLREQHGTAFLLISHSTGVLRSVADKVMTMADGRLIAPGPTVSPAVAAPSPDRGQPSGATAPRELRPVLSARAVTKIYRRRQQLFSRYRAPLPAVADVDLDVAAGSTLGLIGESGAGKSTLARCLAGLERADAGEIRVDGRDLVRMHRRDRLPFHRQVQMIHQDSVSALNPRFTAEDVVTEPLAIQGIGTRADRKRQARELMTMVGLPPDRSASRPSEFSGGERQRLAIARALALRPRVLILDEPFSGLDRANQERILDVLDQWRHHHGLTCMCISHDLALMASFTSHLAVMHQGHIVERGPTARLLGAPCHPQTRALVAAAFPVPAATVSLAG